MAGWSRRHERCRAARRRRARSRHLPPPHRLHGRARADARLPGRADPRARRGDPVREHRCARPPRAEAGPARPAGQDGPATPRRLLLRAEHVVSWRAAGDRPSRAADGGSHPFGRAGRRRHGPHAPRNAGDARRRRPRGGRRLQHRRAAGPTRAGQPRRTGRGSGVYRFADVGDELLLQTLAAGVWRTATSCSPTCRTRSTARAATGSSRRIRSRCSPTTC